MLTINAWTLAKIHVVYKLYVMFTTILQYANVLRHYKGMHLLLVTESQVHIY